MAFRADLEGEVKDIFETKWSLRDGTVVPSDDSVGLGNDGANIDATVLYADLADSTVLVDTFKKEFAAEIYKSFLRCAARIIRDNGGTITAYDGDRVMAVFVGGVKNSAATRTGLKINWAVKNIIQPAILAQYPGATYALRHVVGIDTSKLLVARTGIRGANDLVWVGGAANRAAKLSSLNGSDTTWITKAVYERLQPESKLCNGVDMWTRKFWTSMDGAEIYSSDYLWAI